MSTAGVTGATATGAVGAGAVSAEAATAPATPATHNATMAPPATSLRPVSRGLRDLVNLVLIALRIVVGESKKDRAYR